MFIFVDRNLFVSIFVILLYSFKIFLATNEIG